MKFFLSTILRLLARGLGAFAAISFGPYLGSKGIAIMTSGINLVLFAILIFGLIFLFRLNKKSGFLRVFFYISIFFFISLYGYYLRIYFMSRLGLSLHSFLPFLILSVSEGVISYSGAWEVQPNRMFPAETESGASGAEKAQSGVDKASGSGEKEASYELAKGKRPLEVNEINQDRISILGTLLARQ